MEALNMDNEELHESYIRLKFTTEMDVKELGNIIIYHVIGGDVNNLANVKLYARTNGDKVHYLMKCPGLPESFLYWLYTSEEIKRGKVRYVPIESFERIVDNYEEVPYTGIGA